MAFKESEYAAKRGIQHIELLCKRETRERVLGYGGLEAAIRPLNEEEADMILAAPVGRRSGTPLEYPTGSYLAHVYIEKVPVYVPDLPEDVKDSMRLDELWDFYDSHESFEQDDDHPVMLGMKKRIFRGSGCGESITGVSESISGFRGN